VEKTPADTGRQFRQFLSRLLQEEKIGTMLFDKGSYILHARADKAQHVPAYNLQLLDPQSKRS
jgi:hypothetical protein